MTIMLTAPQKEPDTSAPTEDAPREFHWTVETFDRACDAGVFGPEARLELIHGRIIEKMPQSLLHANVVEYCADCLRAALTPRFRVREEKPIHIAFDGKPIPDIALIRGQLTDSHQPLPQPADVVLLVEVAVSTVAGDLGEKALLYAEAGINDYWVALPERGHIVVHRGPSPDGYASITIHEVGETVAPLAATDIALPVADLLGETTQSEYENA